MQPRPVTRESHSRHEGNRDGHYRILTFVGWVLSAAFGLAYLFIDGASRRHRSGQECARLRQAEVQIADRVDRHGARSEREVEAMTAVGAARVEEMQVIAGHRDSLLVAWTEVAGKCSRD